MVSIKLLTAFNGNIAMITQASLASPITIDSFVTKRRIEMSGPPRRRLRSDEAAFLGSRRTRKNRAAIPGAGRILFGIVDSASWIPLLSVDMLLSERLGGASSS
jgi:hypothetical protein